MIPILFNAIFSLYRKIRAISLQIFHEIHDRPNTCNNMPDDIKQIIILKRRKSYRNDNQLRGHHFSRVLRSR